MVTVHGNKGGYGAVVTAREFFGMDVVEPLGDDAGKGGFACLISARELLG